MRDKGWIAPIAGVDSLKLSRAAGSTSRPRRLAAAVDTEKAAAGEGSRGGRLAVKRSRMILA